MNWNITNLIFGRSNEEKEIQKIEELLSYFVTEYDTLLYISNQQEIDLLINKMLDEHREKTIIYTEKTKRNSFNKKQIQSLFGRSN